MIVLLFFLTSVDTLNFYVDPVVYRSTITIMDTIEQTTKKEDIFYLEFNCAIPYHELSYETKNNTIRGRATIIFKLTNLNRADSLIDTLYRQFSIPSFATAAKEQISFIIQFGLHLPAGDYRYEIKVISGDKEGKAEKKLSICKKDYRMSDLLLAKEIVKDTIENYLRKGNLRVVPHPSHWFTERYTTLYIYYEIYDIVPDSNRIKVVYTIKDEAGKTLRKIPQYVEKKFTSQALNLGLNIETFKTGRYTLVVEVEDPSAAAPSRKQTSFRIIKAVKEEPISYEGLPYYDKIGIFLSPAEYRAFQNMPEQGKKTYLQKFWTKMDYFEIARRFEYAEDHYRQGNKPGYETDRGKIYVKYGPPDEKELSTIAIEESKPYERWYYFNGYQFIFVDVRGTNEFTLVWTNVRDEHSQPTLYKYLPRAIREEIE